MIKKNSLEEIKKEAVEKFTGFEYEGVDVTDCGLLEFIDKLYAQAVKDCIEALPKKLKVGEKDEMGECCCCCGDGGFYPCANESFNDCLYIAQQALKKLK